MNLKTVCVLSLLLIIIPNSTADHPPPTILIQFDLLLLSKDPPQSCLLLNTKDFSKQWISLPSQDDDSTHYDHITPDPATDLLYLSTNTGLIGFTSLQNSSRFQLIAISNGTITELTYNNDKLYWIQDMRSIKSMNSDGSNVTLIVRSRENEKLQGLTVDQTTGTLYYSTWPIKRTNASIYAIPRNSSAPTAILSNLLLPSSLSFSPPYLHWITNPPGIHFTIERLNTETQEEKRTIMKQPHQHGNSLAVTCTGVYWTDASDKRVWMMDKKTSKYATTPGGTNLPSDMLRDQENVHFKNVVAIPQTCDPQPIIMRSALFTEPPPSSSSSEVTKSPPKSNQIRFCTEKESLSKNCDQSTHVCVVIISSTPLCICQTENCGRPQSTPPTQVKETQEKQTENQNSTFLLHSFPQSSWPPESIIIISVLSTLATVMSLISLYMTIRVRNLSKKPIIRRRVVVSTRTSESGSSTPASVCEMIDIENCCNMNVCETPCYERTLLQPSASTQSCSTTTTQSVISVNSSNSNWAGCGGSKKEDKKCLLTR